MRFNTILAVSCLTLSFSFFATNLKGQALGLEAASYDFFLFNGPASSPNDSNTTYADFVSEMSFDGLMGFGRNSWIYADSDFEIDGELRRHTSLYKPNEFNPAYQPGHVTTSNAATNAELDLVNSQLITYINQLTALSSTQSFGNRTTALTYNTTSHLSVLDFTGITMSGVNDKITINGRTGVNNGLSDTVIIRVNGDALWEDGAPVILNNIDRRNVIWLSMGDNDFDLHKNDFAIFEGVIINRKSTTGSADWTTIIGDVDFRGQVYASHIKLGSGVVFEGSSIFGPPPPVPEPSSALLVLTAGMGLFFFRRRR
ncbi:PEP-CTERM sorting domain-containing protein [Phragmitibacter flavus]|uniref:PEP-CTERM sorting domain-containing protein n=1 Tax=Phragmitibacter flavus TaxID=2576071 RepID=A0A5R8KK38_9BACT|nr:PEP-CTERM sorting domain-containing protein [Phragmitibacter flavus]TLD72662.1 PEP-CTERM sorting domain-containing protein [Phragmitibacter flavus]